MKISNAIAIIALCAQGYFLHADAAYKLRVRGTGGEPSNAETVSATDNDNVGYQSRDKYLACYPELEESFIEKATTFEKRAQPGAGSGVGAYLQTQVASKHGERCKFPFPACGKGARCYRRQKPNGDMLNPICVDDDKCAPSYVRLRNWYWYAQGPPYTQVREDPQVLRKQNRCCSGESWNSGFPNYFTTCF